MSFLGIIAGFRGCEDQVGAGTYTPSGKDSGKKIVAIGIVAAAEVTSFQYKQTIGNDIVIDGKAWMGVSLSSSTPANGYIPLDFPSDNVIVASGTVRMFFG